MWRNLTGQRGLFRRKLIATNPLERLHLEIRLPKRLPRNLQTSEIRKLVAIAPECINRSPHETHKTFRQRELWDLLTARLAIEVMTLTGVRVGELVKLRWSDIDQALHQMKINGKGNRERQVSFPDPVTLDRLHAYREQVSLRFQAANALFVNGLGRSANEQYVRRVVRKFAEAAELDRRITPHMLRHTAATQLLEAGLDIRFVQKLLGHASITTTEIYTHVADQKLRAEIRRVNIRERLEMQG